MNLEQKTLVMPHIEANVTSAFYFPSGNGNMIAGI